MEFGTVQLETESGLYVSICYGALLIGATSLFVVLYSAVKNLV
jgi:hypothetical protein